ncbi:MAG: DciA family protein [Zoogloeaceae bacterium]|jgi:hypothetical protein|nr:DciA family protein [Zoogloeaceae bacterium]
MLSPETLLEHSGEYARLLVHARLLTRLGALFAAAAPAGLAARARVANYRRGAIVLHAINGAVASKLRQLTPRLAESFSKNGVECNRIEVKVQPALPCATPRATKRKPLSARSAATISANIQSMPKTSSLAQALRTLLERAEIES